jgi:Bifunctional DNA primase/polymerase, N-terminal
VVPVATGERVVNVLLDAALGYAARGWPVLPVQPRGKAPCTAHGLHDATTGPDMLREWWARWPDANVGLRTGDAFHVLDVDGQGGFDSLARLTLVEHEKLASGPCVLTPSGGFHLYFAPPPRQIGNRARFITGCDWRGEGGYVVAPPSVGANGTAYLWDPYFDAATPLETVDGWLVDLLDPPRPAQATRLDAAPAVLTDAYVTAALEREARAVAGTPEGGPDRPGRNHRLNVAAFNLGTLVGTGRLDRALVERVLEVAAHDCGLDQCEAASTIASGLDAGISQPRKVP